jgi:WD40 repeat protein
VAVVDLADGGLYAASTSSDATLRVWFRASQEAAWVCVQTIARAPKMFEAVAIARLPPLPSSSSSPSHEQVIVAAGGVDGGIHIFAQQKESQQQTGTQQPTDTQQIAQFKQLVVLEGHQDWIRCLSFALTDTHTLLLASSSQDNRVRLWSFAPLQGSQMESLLGTESARISSKGHVVDLYSDKFVILLDAVLAAHEVFFLFFSYTRTHRKICFYIVFSATYP